MPYDRDEVITSVTEFYNFLVTHLHFEPSDLKTPPPTGWPKITQARLAFLGKSDKAIDLLQHLPYLPPYGLFQKEIYTHTVCVDYNQEAVDQHLQDPELFVNGNFEPDYKDDEDVCPFESFRERHEDVIVLDMPEKSDDGCWIFLDTLTGEVALWDIWHPGCGKSDSAKEFFAGVRQEFEKIRIFPIQHEVAGLGNSSGDFKDWIRSFWWPPAREDGTTWKRDECLKQIRDKADEMC